MWRVSAIYRLIFLPFKKKNDKGGTSLFFYKNVRPLAIRVSKYSEALLKEGLSSDISSNELRISLRQSINSKTSESSEGFACL